MNKKVIAALLAYFAAVGAFVGVDEVKQSKDPIPVPPKTITLSLLGLGVAACYFSRMEDKERTEAEKKHIAKHSDAIKKDAARQNGGN